MIRIEKINKYLLFAPFLVLYILITILLHTNSLEGDQARYVNFATNLCHGFYSPPFPNMDLMSGPGYPILLMPFVMLGLPLFFMKLLNPVFLYLSVIFIFKICNRLVDFKKSLILSIIFGFYYPFYQYLPTVHSEITAIFLISILIYSLVRIPEKNNFFHRILLPAIIIAYLALTKVIFGYAIASAIIILFILGILKKSDKIKRLLRISLLGLLFCTPYLAYTYSVTGNIFYWGGCRDTLYWMSTPYKGEVGDWHPEFLRPYPELKKNHKAFFDSLKYMGYLQKEKVYTKKAIENIKNYPGHYVANIFANIGRMFFNYPFSYNRHGNIWYYDLAYMFINIFFVVALFFIVLLFILYFPRIDITAGFILLFVLSNLGASALVSAEKRMFFPTVPLIIFFIAYFLSFLNINFRKNNFYIEN